MAKGLCPGVGRFRGKESIEKRGRERPIFPGVHAKPTKPLHRASAAHEGTEHPLEEVLEARAEK